MGHDRTAARSQGGNVRLYRLTLLFLTAVLSRRRARPELEIALGSTPCSGNPTPRHRVGAGARGRQSASPLGRPRRLSSPAFRMPGRLRTGSGSERGAVPACVRDRSRTLPIRRLRNRRKAMWVYSSHVVVNRDLTRTHVESRQPTATPPSQWHTLARLSRCSRQPCRCPRSRVRPFLLQFLVKHEMDESANAMANIRPRPLRAQVRPVVHLDRGAAGPQR